MQMAGYPPAIFLFVPGLTGKGDHRSEGPWTDVSR